MGCGLCMLVVCVCDDRIIEVYYYSIVLTLVDDFLLTRCFVWLEEVVSCLVVVFGD